MIIDLKCLGLWNIFSSDHWWLLLLIHLFVLLFILHHCYKQQNYLSRSTSYSRKSTCLYHFCNGENRRKAAVNSKPIINPGYLQYHWKSRYHINPKIKWTKIWLPNKAIHNDFYCKYCDDDYVNIPKYISCWLIKKGFLKVNSKYAVQSDQCHEHAISIVVSKFN